MATEPTTTGTASPADDFVPPSTTPEPTEGYDAFNDADEGEFAPPPTDADPKPADEPKADGEPATDKEKFKFQINGEDKEYDLSKDDQQKLIRQALAAGDIVAKAKTRVNEARAEIKRDRENINHDIGIVQEQAKALQGAANRLLTGQASDWESVITDVIYDLGDDDTVDGVLKRMANVHQGLFDFVTGPLSEFYKLPDGTRKRLIEAEHGRRSANKKATAAGQQNEQRVSQDAKATLSRLKAEIPKAFEDAKWKPTQLKYKVLVSLWQAAEDKGKTHTAAEMVAMTKKYFADNRIADADDVAATPPAAPAAKPAAPATGRGPATAESVGANNQRAKQGEYKTFEEVFG